MSAPIVASRVQERRGINRLTDGRIFWTMRGLLIDRNSGTRLNVEGQMLTVVVREFIRISVQRSLHSSEFLDPEGPHASGA